MAEYRSIPVGALEEAEHKMREVTRSPKYMGMLASMGSIGLISPITVREYEPGKYRVVAGMHRATAATELGWEVIEAKVLAPGEQDSDLIMASENLHKVDLNEMDEAMMYQRLVQDRHMDPRGISATYNVPESRIRNLLAVLGGDPRCHAHVAAGRMSVAQALEVSQFESEAYKLLAINYAVDGGMSAQRLALWRRDIQSKGMEMGVDDAIARGDTPAMVDVSEPMTLCTLLNHAVKLVGTKQVVICPDCWNTYVAALEALHREAALHDAGLWLPYLAWRKQNLGE